MKDLVEKRLKQLRADHLATARRWLSPQAAEDAVQETHYRLWEKAEAGLLSDQGEKAFASFASGVLWRVCKEMVRKGARELTVEEAAFDTLLWYSPSTEDVFLGKANDEAAQDELWARIEAADLTATQTECLVARFYEEESCVVAERLGISIDCVGAHVRAARRKMVLQ